MAANTSMNIIDLPDPLASLEELSEFYRDLNQEPPGPRKQDALLEWRDLLQLRRELGLPVPKLG